MDFVVHCCFDKDCMKKAGKCKRQPRKVFWVVFRSRFLDLRISGKSEKTSL